MTITLGDLLPILAIAFVAGGLALQIRQTSKNLDRHMEKEERQMGEFHASLHTMRSEMSVRGERAAGQRAEISERVARLEGVKQ